MQHNIKLLWYFGTRNSESDGSARIGADYDQIYSTPDNLCDHNPRSYTPPRWTHCDVFPFISQLDSFLQESLQYVNWIWHSFERPGYLAWLSGGVAGHEPPREVKAIRN